MVSLVELWLPILLAAVFVFLVSSVIHMVLPWHRADATGMPGEDTILDAVRSAGVKPGQYMFPWCASMKEYAGEEMRGKLERGPVGSLVVLGPGGWNMGRSMGAWFLYCLVVALFCGYLASMVFESGAGYERIHRFVGTVGVLGFAFWHVPVSIWKGAPWRVTWRFVVDGVVYGLVMGGTFGWLWPAAA